jgi:hypothetical protein
MLRTRNVQPLLWESALPEVCLRLPAELEQVDPGWTMSGSSLRSGRTSTPGLVAPGIVLDYTVEEGNPADAPQLAPAITRITSRVGACPVR